MLGTAQLAIILVGSGSSSRGASPGTSRPGLVDRARGGLRAQPAGRRAPGQRRGKPDRGGSDGCGDKPGRPSPVAGQGARHARAAVHAAPVEPLRTQAGIERHRAEPRAESRRTARPAHRSWQSAGVQRGDCPAPRARQPDHIRLRAHPLSTSTSSRRTTTSTDTRPASGAARIGEILLRATRGSDVAFRCGDARPSARPSVRARGSRGTAARRRCRVATGGLGRHGDLGRHGARRRRLGRRRGRWSPLRSRSHLRCRR